MTTPILNWVPSFDERSRNFPIRTVIPTRPPRVNKLWRTGPILDQGSEGACVGFGWTAEVLSTPVAVNLSLLKEPAPSEPTEFALNLYQMAKRLDVWEGEDYDGTSVLAGAKACVALGTLKEYRWCFSTEDVVNAVLSRGPVVLGMNWHEGMYEAPNGILTPSGPIVGGHCLTAVGFRWRSDRLDGEDGIVLQNSWGASWGNNGLAVIRVSELEKLLQADGEACVPYRRSYGRNPIPRKR